MAYPPGMELHGSTWRVNKRVPLDLFRTYPQFYPKALIRFDTGESDKPKAAVKARAWLGDIEEEFQRVRETGSKHRLQLPEEEAELIIRRVIHSRLSADESIRVAGVDDLTFAKLDEANEESRRKEQLAIARGVLTTSATELAHEWLFAHGYDIPNDSEEFRQFALCLFRRLTEATKISDSRQRGEWVDTPPVPEREVKRVSVSTMLWGVVLASAWRGTTFHFVGRCA